MRRYSVTAPVFKMCSHFTHLVGLVYQGFELRLVVQARLDSQVDGDGEPLRALRRADVDLTVASAPRSCQSSIDE